MKYKYNSPSFELEIRIISRVCVILLGYSNITSQVSFKNVIKMEIIGITYNFAVVHKINAFIFIRNT